MHIERKQKITLFLTFLVAIIGMFFLFLKLSINRKNNVEVLQKYKNLKIISFSKKSSNNEDKKNVDKVNENVKKEKTSIDNSSKEEIKKDYDIDKKADYYFKELMEFSYPVLGIPNDQLFKIEKIPEKYKCIIGPQFDDFYKNESVNSKDPKIVQENLKKETKAIAKSKTILKNSDDNIEKPKIEKESDGYDLDFSDVVDKEPVEVKEILPTENKFSFKLGDVVIDEDYLKLIYLNQENYKPKFVQGPLFLAYSKESINIHPRKETKLKKEIVAKKDELLKTKKVTLKVKKEKEPQTKEEIEAKIRELDKQLYGDTEDAESDSEEEERSKPNERKDKQKSEDDYSFDFSKESNDAEEVKEKKKKKKKKKKNIYPKVIPKSQL